MERTKTTITNLIKGVEVNRYYDMGFNEACLIKEISPGTFDMICNAFRYGYGQGAKAAATEHRKSTKAI